MTAKKVCANANGYIVLSYDIENSQDNSGLGWVDASSFYFFSNLPVATELVEVASAEGVNAEELYIYKVGDEGTIEVEAKVSF